QFIPQLPRTWRGYRFWHGKYLLFPGSELVGHGTGLQCSLISNAVQPIADHVLRDNRRRFAEQHQERGLECIFRVGLIAENTLADAKNHWAVPMKQRLDGRLVAPFDELAQQMPIR